MNTQPNVSTDVFSEAKLGPITLRNRIIKAATFEASTPDALVTDDLIRYHQLPAAGGTGEFFSLTGEEYPGIIQTAVDTCRGKVPIIAGAGRPTIQLLPP